MPSVQSFVCGFADGSVHEEFGPCRRMVRHTSVKSASVLNSATVVSAHVSSGILRIVVSVKLSKITKEIRSTEPISWLDFESRSNGRNSDEIIVSAHASENTSRFTGCESGWSMHPAVISESRPYPVSSTRRRRLGRGRFVADAAHGREVELKPRRHEPTVESPTNYRPTNSRRLSFIEQLRTD